MNSFQAMAIRQITARGKLVDAIKRNGGIDDAKANKVADLYLKVKIAKLDAVIGQFTVKHGVFLEKDVIANAVEMTA